MPDILGPSGLRIGTGVGGATDTNLVRGGVDTVKTDDTMLAAGMRVGSGLGGLSVPVVLDNDSRVRDGGSVLLGNGAPGYTQRFLEDFSSDRLATDYDASSLANVAVSGGSLLQTTATVRTMRVKPSLVPSLRYPRLTNKIFTGTVLPSSSYMLMFSYIDDSNYIICGLIGSSLRINKIDAGVSTILKSVAPAGIAVGTNYWQRAWIDAAGLITSELWTTDPALGGAPLASLTHQLGAAPGVAGDLAKYAISAPVGWRAAQTTGNGWTMDDFKVESAIGDDGDFYRQIDAVPPYSLEYGPRQNESWGTPRPIGSGFRGLKRRIIGGSNIASPGYYTFGHASNADGTFSPTYFARRDDNTYRMLVAGWYRLTSQVIAVNCPALSRVDFQLLINGTGQQIHRVTSDQFPVGQSAGKLDFMWEVTAGQAGVDYFGVYLTGPGDAFHDVGAGPFCQLFAEYLGPIA